MCCPAFLGQKLSTNFRKWPGSCASAKLHLLLAVLQIGCLDGPRGISYVLKLKLLRYYAPSFRRTTLPWVFLKINLIFSLGKLGIFIFLWWTRHFAFCLLCCFFSRVLKHTRAITGLHFSYQVEIFRKVLKVTWDIFYSIIILNTSEMGHYMQQSIFMKR